MESDDGRPEHPFWYCAAESHPPRVYLILPHLQRSRGRAVATQGSWHEEKHRGSEGRLDGEKHRILALARDDVPSDGYLSLEMVALEMRERGEVGEEILRTETMLLIKLCAWNR